MHNHGGCLAFTGYRVRRCTLISPRLGVHLLMFAEGSDMQIAQDVLWSIWNGCLLYFFQRYP